MAVLKLDVKPKYYFHCSQNLTKKTIQLTPRDKGENRSEEEPNIFRICVAPKISCCLAAVSFSICQDIYVYMCYTKAWTPYGVMDSDVTDEKWILEKSKFEKIFKIEKKFLKDFKFCEGFASRTNVNINKNALKNLYDNKNILIKNPFFSKNIKLYF